MQTDKKNIYGFTLAETLITLVIIGIVAALTVPTMMQNKQKEELKAGLHKAQTTLSNALELYYAKNGERLTPSDCNSNGGLKKAIKPYLISFKDCNLADCITKQADNNRESDIYRTFNNRVGANTVYLDDGQFLLNDGMLVLIENPTGSNKIFVSVDVNGFKKKPNRAGHDLFMFQLSQKGNLIPMGTNGTDFTECSESSTNSTNGFGCTAKALSDPNYFKNLH